MTSHGNSLAKNRGQLQFASGQLHETQEAEEADENCSEDFEYESQPSLGKTMN